MDDSPQELQALYIVDGKPYPECTNAINRILVNEPRLLSDTPDAVKARKWLRDKRRKDDEEPCGWIGHLYWISVSMENRSRENPAKNWQNLNARPRQRKTMKIIKLIDDLIEALEDEDLPREPTKAYELFDSWEFFYRESSSNLIHAFAKKEHKIPIYQESITDLLRTLQKEFKGLEKCTYGRESGSKPSRGNPQARSLANELATYLMKRYQPKTKPNETIAALLSIHFPEECITSEMIREWIN